MRLEIDQAPRDRIRPTLPPPEADSYGTILPAQDGFLPLPSAQLRTNFHGVASMSGWRWRRDLNPRKVSLHTLSRSADTALEPVRSVSARLDADSLAASLDLPERT